MQRKLNWAALVAVGALFLAAPALADDDYEVGLVPCTESLCGASGSAPFEQGSVSVEDEGRVEVELEGGPASAMLCVEFRPLVGEPAAVGDLMTDLEGTADATVGMFELGVFMGAFVVKDGNCESEGAPLFITAFAVGSHQDEVDDGEDDNDGDGVLNDLDADDDNDQIVDGDDMDDDNDGIPDLEDADPDDANNFDNDNVEELKAAYQAERQELKDEYKADSSALKLELKDDKEALKEDLEDRLDDF